ncbi:hypothetical protein R3P38DRAFT_3165708 [Favolaschia claudopus]|uniref:Uncharacterized protein n=1 Tax=Favolaschia claudopus TaxID=2862362 RepID=A0AAW0EI99_9AGAR
MSTPTQAPQNCFHVNQISLLTVTYQRITYNSPAANTSLHPGQMTTAEPETTSSQTIAPSPAPVPAPVPVPATITPIRKLFQRVLNAIRGPRQRT